MENFGGSFSSDATGSRRRRHVIEDVSPIHFQKMKDIVYVLRSSTQNYNKYKIICRQLNVNY